MTSEDFFNLAGEVRIAKCSEGSAQENRSTTLDGRGSDYEKNKSLSDIKSDDQELSA